MEIIKTKFDGLVVLSPKVYGDNRGYFFESFNQQSLIDNGLNINFVQDNESKSSYGVIRGLHIQKPPHSQTKLIRVLEGVIYDVVVDIRTKSSTYGKWYGIELSSDNKLQFLIPKGFCHGFSVLSESATILYKCDDFYHPELDTGIKFDDPDLNIDWKVPADKIIVSEKDNNLPYIKN